MAQALHVPMLHNIPPLNLRLRIFSTIFSPPALPLMGPINASIFCSPFARPETYVDVGVRYLGIRKTDADHVTVPLIFVRAIQ